MRQKTVDKTAFNDTFCGTDQKADSAEKDDHISCKPVFILRMTAATIHIDLL